MDQRTDLQLLREWIDHRNREAIGELIRRHIDFVLNTARRQVRNDAHLAEDITQAVFILLLQKAHRIKNEATMAGWLFTTTRFAASNARRMIRRRQFYEQQAVAHFVPQRDDRSHVDDQELVNEAIAHLSRGDRECLVMSYLQQKTNRQVAEALGVSEDAARVRVTRAVRRLRDFFITKGVATAGDGAMTALLVAGKSSAASAALIESTLNVAMLSHSVASASSAVTIAKGVSNMFFAMKLKAAVMVGVVVFGGMVTAQVVQNALNHAAATITTGQIQDGVIPEDSSAVSLGDGVSVRFLGAAKWGANEWYSIEGKPIAWPQGVPKKGSDDLPPGARVLPAPMMQVAVLVIAPKDARTLLEVPQATGTIFYHSEQISPTEIVERLGFSVPPNIETVDIEYSVADQPWRTAMSVRPNNSLESQANAEIRAVFMPLIERNGRTSAYVTVPDTPGLLWRVGCMDINGDVYPGKQGEVAGVGGVMMKEFRFDQAPVLIQSLELQTRQYNKRVVAKNVTLDPKKITKPQIVVGKNPDPAK